MRHNGRPHVRASRMYPGKLDLAPGVTPMVACPDCDTWRVLRRAMVTPHRAGDELTRCPGSGQRIWLDLSPGEWAQRLAEAIADADALKAGDRGQLAWPLRVTADS